MAASSDLKLRLCDRITVDALARIIYTIQQDIAAEIEHLGQGAFRATTFRFPDATSKNLAVVDSNAELSFMRQISQAYGKETYAVWGEESIYKALDLSGESRLVLLADIVDGTDLRRRAFSNWCSAVVAFSPRDRSIEGAMVIQPMDDQLDCYFATRNSPAFVGRIDRAKGGIDRKSIRELNCQPDKISDLRNAAVCSYGQSSKALSELLKLGQRKKFVEWLSENIAKDKANEGLTNPPLDFRFYNLAGNPMMTRLADGAVDIVFDNTGQKAHDVVPGAYIALRAGAYVCSTDGKDISVKDLAEALLRPDFNRLKYVLARNKTIASQLIELIAD